MENGDLHYFDSEKVNIHLHLKCILYQVVWYDWSSFALHFSQSPKPVGTIGLLDCHRVFDPKTKGLHVNYCLGMEVGENTYYVKADTASLYNTWLTVSFACIYIVHVYNNIYNICMYDNMHTYTCTWIYIYYYHCITCTCTWSLSYTVFLPGHSPSITALHMAVVTNRLWESSILLHMQI